VHRQDTQLAAMASYYVRNLPQKRANPNLMLEKNLHIILEQSRKFNYRKRKPGRASVNAAEEPPELQKRCSTKL
jgi:hypothetical protein